ncbi:hypothetical protein AAVH_14873 [Aphelenchoides avenae]|nr:hypothetical protein AAVH_14873 [Aphelenchus avenae]
MLRVQCTQPPLPIIDGFVCKDLAVHLKRSGTQIKDAQWTASMNQPNNKFLVVGAINASGIPSIYLPADTLPDGEPKYYNRIAASNRYPLADITRKEFDEEQSILPSIFIIGHTYGVFPQYATMVTSETRILLSSKIRPTTKLYSSLRNAGIGPAGYDLKGAEPSYIDDSKDQRTALVRLGRVARHADRCLRVTISYSEIPGNFDPHQDAINELKENSDLHENHPIHLVSYTNTALHMLKWLREFPNVVFGISLYQLLYHTGVLENTEPNTQTYKDSAMFGTLLQRIPLRHIAIQSACTFPIPGSHFSPHQLLGIGDAFERLPQTQLSGAALYAHSAQNLQRL